MREKKILPYIILKAHMFHRLKQTTTEHSVSQHIPVTPARLTLPLQYIQKDCSASCIETPLKHTPFNTNSDTPEFG